jgi:hypothetical protein
MRRSRRPSGTRGNLGAAVRARRRAIRSTSVDARADAGIVARHRPGSIAVLPRYVLAAPVALDQKLRVRFGLISIDMPMPASNQPPN